MSRYLKAVIVMRSPDDIRVDQYVCDTYQFPPEVEEDHVASVTLTAGAIDVAFEQVSRWFTAHIEKIERDRAAEENARRRAEEIEAGLQFLISRGGPRDAELQEFYDLATPPLQRGYDFRSVLLLVASSWDELPPIVRVAFSGVIARIGANRLQAGK